MHTCYQVGEKKSINLDFIKRRSGDKEIHLDFFSFCKKLWSQFRGEKILRQTPLEMIWTFIVMCCHKENGQPVNEKKTKGSHGNEIIYFQAGLSTMNSEAKKHTQTHLETFPLEPQLSCTRCFHVARQRAHTQTHTDWHQYKSKKKQYCSQDHLTQE